MSDVGHSTLSSATASSAQEELAKLIEHGFPPIPGSSGSETELREKADTYALAVAYAWLTPDAVVQEVFLDELLDMRPDSIGIMFALERFTLMRLYGMWPGTLRAGTIVTTQWRPSVKNAAKKTIALAAPEMCIAMITALWTAVATGNLEHVARLRAEIHEWPRHQVRDLLRVMSYDTSLAIEEFAMWRSVGADAIEDYRREFPILAVEPRGASVPMA